MSLFVDSDTDNSVCGDRKNVSHPTPEPYHLKYEKELSQLFQLTGEGIDHVAHLAVTGKLENSYFRSIIWQILLGILPLEHFLWVQRLRQLRNIYRSRRDALVINPHLAPEGDNPLSEGSSSVWHQYFCDLALQDTIRKDVVRTSPGDMFFRSESIQCTMVNILFTYAREHHEICYRQGMHEVLAPLLLVLHADQQALLEMQKIKPVQGAILEVLDHSCLEEDAYWLLDSIMKHLACIYFTPDVTPSSAGVVLYQSANPVESESEVCSRMRRIRDELLNVWDPELRQHLVELDIPLYYGIRWLRVMFGQEFMKESLLILWDAIFGANANFVLVNYIVVAMLIVIRNRLLEEDSNGCLELLIHYPADNQVHNILRLALHMLKPSVYPRPHDVLDLAKSSVVSGSSTISGRIRRLVSRSRKTDSQQTTTWPPTARSSMSSSKSSRFDRFERGDVYVHNHPRHSQRRSHRHSHRNPNQDSTELLTCLQSKVYLTSLRLAKYHSTLEQHLSASGASPSVLNAVEGVREIADMLAALGPSEVEVETAVEATQSPSSPDPIIASPNRKSVRDMDNELMPIESRGKTSCESNFVLSNLLRNGNGSADFETERDTYTHRAYRHLLGEGYIFARIKQ